MKKIFAVSCLLFAGILFFPANLAAQKHSKSSKKEKQVIAEPNYDDSTAEELPVPDPTGLVSDFGHIFTKGQNDTLSAIIKTFKDSTQDEIAIVAWDTIHLGPGQMAAYTKKLAEAWDIGEKNKGNGIVIAIALNLREIKIINSTGGLTDEDAYKIVHKIMLPYFMNKNYYGGTMQGLNAVRKKLTE